MGLSANRAACFSMHSKKYRSQLLLSVGVHAKKCGTHRGKLNRKSDSGIIHRPAHFGSGVAWKEKKKNNND